MSCHEYEPLIERLLAEEIGDRERDRLLHHTEGCQGCREFVDLHYRLHDAELATDLPTDAEFAGMRRTVVAQIRQEQPAPAFSGVRDFFRSLVRQPALAGGLAAIMVAMLAAGYVVGRDAGPAPVSLGHADPMMVQIAQEASANRGLADVENARFLYSNVRFQETPTGEIALSFDVTRHMEVARQKDDPLVKEVLAQSLVNPTSVGTRLDAIGHAGQMVDPKIEQVLIHSMLNDENFAVRMRALNILRGYPRSAQIEEAFIMVLSGEENVQLRIQALDWLAAGGELSRERFDDVMQNLQVQDPAFQAQAERYANELN